MVLGVKLRPAPSTRGARRGRPSGPAAAPGSRSSASSTPGTNASRESVSWRIVSSWPGPPSSTSWCATRPGSRTEWIGGSPPIAAAVAFAVPDGASSFVSWWSSTISARGRCRAASAAKRIISTAPIAKFGARKTGNAALRASALAHARSRSAQPVVPTTHGTPALERSARRSPTTASGRVKSTAASAPRASSRRSRRQHLVPGRLERRAEHRADLPPAAEQDDLHAAAASPGWTRSTRLEEALLARPDPRRRDPRRARAARRPARRPRPARPRRSRR